MRKPSRALNSPNNVPAKQRKDGVWFRVWLQRTRQAAQFVCHSTIFANPSTAQQQHGGCTRSSEAVVDGCPHEKRAIPESNSTTATHCRGCASSKPSKQEWKRPRSCSSASMSFWRNSACSNNFASAHSVFDPRADDRSAPA